MTTFRYKIISITFAAVYTLCFAAPSQAACPVAAQCKITASLLGLEGVFHGINSNAGIGIYGSGLIGIWGQGTRTNGVGVAGLVTTSGTTKGIVGEVLSNAGKGVEGIAKSTNGTTYGVYGKSASPAGFGVYGINTAATGYATGGYFRTNSNAGIGMYALAAKGSGVTYGAVARTNSASPGAAGLIGQAAAGTGVTRGVVGQTHSASSGAVGVFGYAIKNSGVNFGVYGRTNSNAGFAGYFAGRVHVAGNLSKASGSFKIDHPLEPERKFLQHSFVESPDMMNIYNGNVTLDDNGEATVGMPDYFEALNRDYRYQLTGIGAFAPLYIARKIENGTFHIAGGKPGMEVSWQVTGVRNDAHAKANRIKVVVAKTGDEIGRYIDPVAHGKPRDKGIYFQTSADDDMLAMTDEKE